MTDKLVFTPEKVIDLCTKKMNPPISADDGTVRRVLTIANNLNFQEQTRVTLNELRANNSDTSGWLNLERLAGELGATEPSDKWAAWFLIRDVIKSSEAK